MTSSWKTRNSRLGLCSTIVAAPCWVGCGNEDGGEEPGGPTGGVAAGGTGGAGERTGGASSGGSTDTWYAGECSPPASRWSLFPDETQPDAGLAATVLDDCPGYEDPQADKPDLSTVGDWAGFGVPDPMTPGQPYTISWDGLAEVDRNVRLWGIDGQCGPRRELLYEGVLSASATCLTFTPQQAWEDLLIVFVEGPTNQVNAMTYCPGGSCG